VTWGYQTAAVVRAWTVHKSLDGGWTLHAGIDRADPLRLKQAPLRFVAPRAGGFFTWPVKSITVGREFMTATLDAPER
jgi:hypothetical protein